MVTPARAEAWRKTFTAPKVLRDQPLNAQDRDLTGEKQGIRNEAGMPLGYRGRKSISRKKTVACPMTLRKKAKARAVRTTA
jgi:hypothetical protein